jgi:hypothetical protein
LSLKSSPASSEFVLDQEGFVPAHLLSSPVEKQESCQRAQRVDLHMKMVQKGGHNPAGVKGIVAVVWRPFTYAQRLLT